MLAYLDVDDLDLASQLEDLVLDLAHLERISVSARGCINLGIEVVRLSGLGGLAHVVHSLEDIGRDRSQIDVVEWVDEDRVGFSLRVAANAIGDLELRIAKMIVSLDRPQYPMS